ncbi:LegC family aminotransferase [bacterium]|nr:LegC family aminotransferase [bacterium]
MLKFQETIDFIRSIYNTQDLIPLHEPRFWGNEKKYLEECIDSTFVSSVGKFVDQIEVEIAKYTGAKKAVAVVNGTAALHIALKLVGVEAGTEVITQPLTFIATANAISYCGAKPIFLDVDLDTMGLSPIALKRFLEEETVWDSSSNKRLNKLTNKQITACVPMHTFGHACRIDEIVDICNEYNIPVVEDSAESIGTYYKEKHTGTFGKVGILSFNGNKTITSGGGGMIITDDEELAKQAKHLTTTAKIPHKWEYRHDHIGYNYRMPNINAALACAQLEQLDSFIEKKRALAKKYSDFFLTSTSSSTSTSISTSISPSTLSFFVEPKNSISNYWLNVVILKNREERDLFLKETNENGVMTRPIWTLMNKLEMFRDCYTDTLENAEWLEDRVVNISSSVI